MLHFLLRLVFLALFSPPILAGDAEQQSHERAPSAALIATTSTASLSPRVIVGLFIGSALLSFTLRFMVRKPHRRPRGLDFPKNPARTRADDLLLTSAERDFLAVLQALVHPVCRISIKVRLTDLFEVRPERGHQAVFDLISNKRVDFILTEQETGLILGGIELEDLTHRQADRADYDAIVDQLFASQHLPLLRIPSAVRHHPEALLGEFAGIIAKPPSRRS